MFNLVCVCFKYIVIKDGKAQIILVCCYICSSLKRWERRNSVKWSPPICVCMGWQRSFLWFDGVCMVE